MTVLEVIQMGVIGPFVGIGGKGTTTTSSDFEPIQQTAREKKSL
jgi:hypothetical protein